MQVKIFTPVTLALTSESAFRFQNLRLGFKNWLLFIYPLIHTIDIYISHKCLRANPFQACQHFDPCDLDLYLKPLPSGELRCLLAALVCLAHTCLWTRPFHECQHFYPVTLTLTLESAFRFQTQMPRDKSFLCMSTFWPLWPWPLPHTPSTRRALLSSGNSCSLTT